MIIKVAEMRWIPACVKPTVKRPWVRTENTHVCHILYRSSVGNPFFPTSHLRIRSKAIRINMDRCVWVASSMHVYRTMTPRYVACLATGIWKVTFVFPCSWSHSPSRLWKVSLDLTLRWEVPAMRSKITDFDVLMTSAFCCRTSSKMPKYYSTCESSVALWKRLPT